MAKKKPAKKKATPKEKKQPRKDPRVESTYETTVTFRCPTRGLVTQKVKVKRMKTFSEQAALGTPLLGGDDIDKLIEDDGDLSMYEDVAGDEE